MAMPDGDRTASPLRFGRFVLDLVRGSLHEGTREIPLRPKTFALLRYLAENPDRLLSKEELLEAIWPNLIVTDDTLVQSIGELRRALGGEGGNLIVTVPRRGYRFVPAVAPEERRKARGWHPLRFRWVYGILAPLTLGLTLVVVWLAFGRAPAPKNAQGDKPTIAVLPFQFQGDDPQRAYLADGMTQDIIHSLGRFSALTVMSWNAVAGYKGPAAMPGQVAHALNVRYQIEGSVRLGADRLRVTAQLVDSQGRVLWSSRFDEAASDVFALQDRIAREVAGALAIRVSESEWRRVSTQPTSSFDAYDFVLRARPALQRPTRANIVEARAFLRRALELDPTYAAAEAELGETFHVAISMGWAESPDEYWQRVAEHSDAALRLDADESRARILLARMHLAYGRFAAARTEIDRAIEINPNDADALAGRGNILVWLGENDAAIATLELAQRLDPELNAFDRFALGVAYYLDRRYEDAAETAELNLRHNPGVPFTQALLAAAYAQLGRSADAERVAVELRRHDPTFDGATFGNKFLDGRDLARFREGLAKAGLYSPTR
jgi:TolB-like protein/DNA-binding winged helix-turn-helix (wHTH) protein/Flp pilus assembly protein TadD